MVAFLGKICLNNAQNGKSMPHSRLKFVPLQPKYKISCQMDLNSLIAECTAYDFKVMLEERKPKSWLKSVSAFANGLSGSLFFGVDNDGVVKGLDDVQHVCETNTYLQ